MASVFPPLSSQPLSLLFEHVCLRAFVLVESSVWTVLPLGINVAPKLLSVETLPKRFFPGVICHFLPQWTTFVRTLHYAPSVLGGLQGIAHSFTELHKPLGHNKAVIHEGVTNGYYL